MTTLVWIHFLGLSIEQMFPRILLYIAVIIETPLKVDTITTSGIKAKFVEVYIMLQLSQSLPQRI